MAIQALSGVSSKGYTNINFGKRKEQQPEIKHNVTSPMKAVPLAALIAVSPLTKTNAESIMNPVANENMVELAQPQQSERNYGYLYGKIFKTELGTEVMVYAVNTEGRSDSYDKIFLDALGLTFEAKEIVDREAYLYSLNGVKEGPLRFKEVVAETELNGHRSRFSFVNPDIVAFVEAVAAQPTNKSNVQGVRHAYMNLFLESSDGKIVSYSDKGKNEFLDVGKDVLGVGENSTLTNELYHDIFKTNLLSEWTKRLEGSHGTYIMTFYDTDDDLSNAERIIVQKEGDGDWDVDGVFVVNGKLIGADQNINTGTIYCIRTAPAYIVSRSFYITDDILAKEIINFCNSPKYNKSQEYPIEIKEVEQKMVLGDDYLYE